MKNNIIYTADEIYSSLLNEVAPLPCQENYAKQLSTLVSYHCKKCALLDAGIAPNELPYQGGIVVAPTGSGKSYLLKTLGQLFDINIIVLNGSSLCKDGWKGPTLSQQLLSSKKSLGDDSKWEKSILFIDEFDKLKNYGTDQDQGNALENILQLYDQGTVAAEGEYKHVEAIDVSKFTIILAGAFDGLDKIVKKRISPKQGLGFTSEIIVDNLSISDYYQKATLEDLKEYGFPLEILGRIGSILYINPLTKEDYNCLLNAKNGSIVYKYNTFFQFSDGVSFEIDDSAVNFISRRCLKSESGARAVNPLINDAIKDSFIMVDRDKSINKVILKSNEHSCFVDYEYGKRGINLLTNKDETDNQGVYVLQEKSLSLIADKLVKECSAEQFTYREVADLRVFFELCLLYIFKHCNHKDFCLNSLMKLAESAQKKKKNDESTFDVLINKLLSNNKNEIVIKTYYDEFKCRWCKNTASNLIKGTKYVFESLRNKHHCEHINFVVKN